MSGFAREHDLETTLEKIKASNERCDSLHEVRALSSGSHNRFDGIGRGFRRRGVMALIPSLEKDLALALTGDLPGGSPCGQCCTVHLDTAREAQGQG